MRTLVYDTETTGLPPKKDKSNPALWPGIAQFACVLYEDRRPVAHFSAFTIPMHDGVRIPVPKEKFFIDAGITDEIIDAVGLEMRTALAVFNNLLKRADRLAAHNIAFDDKITVRAYERTGLDPALFISKPRACTMASLTDVMKIPSKWGKGYKFPSLAEAYAKYVNPEGFSGAHNALVDVEAAAEVLWGIEDKEIKLVSGASL